MHSITTMENAILAALEPLKASLKVREVAPYGGEIDAEKLKTRTAWPFVLVTYNGTAEVEDHGSRKIERNRWLIIVGDRHKDLARARRGDTNNPGTYSMLRGVQGALEGKQLIADLFPATRLGEDTLVNEADMSVYALHYEIPQGYLA